jgi:dihydropteroate synthase
VNITPDSFSDGGCCADTDSALRRARRLLEAGAHILDLGGESTRPGAAPVSAEEEQRRVLPVLRGAIGFRADAKALFPQLSVDTRHAATAEAVLEAGADMINDVSGEALDPGMAEVAASYTPAYVLVHSPAPPDIMQNHAVYGNVVDTVAAFFERRMTRLVRAGLPESHIALDPGIGFGKTPEQNLDLMRDMERLHGLGRPLYFGVSRKRFLGSLLGLGVTERDTATQVLIALLARAGALVHRVHDVAGAVRALALTTRVCRA